MTERATDSERYEQALRRVSLLKEKYPELHEAVLFVVGKRMGDCHKQFFDEEFTPAEAAKVHTRFQDLREVLRRLANPAEFLREAKKEAPKDGGGPRLDSVKHLLDMGRKVLERVRSGPKKGV